MYRYNFIYKTIIKTENGEYFYIGKHHTNDLNDKYYGSGKIVREYLKQYKNNISRKILIFENDENKLKELERQYIIENIDNKYCLNLIISSAKSNNPYIRTKEIKEKTSKSVKQLFINGYVPPMKGEKMKDHMTEEAYNNMMSKHVTWADTVKGKKRSEEFCKNISERLKLRTGELNSFYGKHHSEESKQKISEANKGRKMTIEQKQKISEASKKLWENPEYRQKISQKLKEANTGKKFSEEHRKHLSEAHKGIIPWNKGLKLKGRLQNDSK